MPAKTPDEGRALRANLEQVLSDHNPNPTLTLTLTLALTLALALTLTLTCCRLGRMVKHFQRLQELGRGLTLTLSLTLTRCGEEHRLHV